MILARQKRPSENGTERPRGSGRGGPPRAGGSQSGVSQSGVSGSHDQFRPDEGVDERVEPTGASPLRRSILTRAVLPKSRMVRFVLDSGRNLVPDIKETLPGRGFWVEADAVSLAAAVKRNAFARAAASGGGGGVVVPPDLLPQTASLLRREALALLGLARKSGQAIAGYEKVAAALRAGRAALLIEACDAGADSRAKLAFLAGSGVEIWALLSAAELAAALGRATVVHVALKPGGLTTALQRSFARLAGFAAAPDRGGSGI